MDRLRSRADALHTTIDKSMQRKSGLVIDISELEKLFLARRRELEQEKERIDRSDRAADRSGTVTPKIPRGRSVASNLSNQAAVPIVVSEGHMINPGDRTDLEERLVQQSLEIAELRKQLGLSHKRTASLQSEVQSVEALRRRQLDQAERQVEAVKAQMSELHVHVPHADADVQTDDVLSGSSAGAHTPVGHLPVPIQHHDHGVLSPAMDESSVASAGRSWDGSSLEQQLAEARMAWCVPQYLV